MGKLTVPEAVQLGEGIVETWKVLVSLLTEADEKQAWTAAGYDRPRDWLGDLPRIPDLDRRDAAGLPPAVTGKKAAVKRPARPARTARVSMPGRMMNTSLGRREVTPHFKDGM